MLQGEQRAVPPGECGGDVGAVGDSGGGAAEGAASGRGHPESAGRGHTDGFPHRHSDGLRPGCGQAPQRQAEGTARQETHPPAHQDTGRHHVFNNKLINKTNIY